MLILLLPTSIQVFHALEDHEHIDDCKEITTHLHEKEIDCSLCDFNLSPSYFQLANQFSFKTNDIPQNPNLELYNFKYYHQQLSFSLRGPPILL